MLEVATLSPNNTLQLPLEVASKFQPSDRFVIWAEGDMLHLKRLHPSPLKAVEHAPLDNPMSLEEINELVHEVRRESRRKVE